MTPPRGSPGAWTRALHVFVIASFAVAQPVYDLLSRQPEFFVFQHAGPETILGLVLALSVALPLGLVAMVRLGRLAGERTERGLHGLVLAVGIGLIVLPLARSVEAVPGIALVYAALIAGAAVAALYASFAPVRLFLTLLGPAVLVFPASFLAFSPVADLLVREGRTPAHEQAPVRRPAPIVFVVFDELPTSSLMDASERIDAERYPAFAALASEATWYRRATTVSESTYEALPAIVSGRLPRPGLLPHAIDHPRTLFTLLAGTHRMHAAGALVQLCPQDLCVLDDPRSAADRLAGILSDLAIVFPHLVLGPDLRALLPPIDHTWQGFGAGRAERGLEATGLGHARRRVRRSHVDRLEKAMGFLERIGSGDRPGLWFLHVLLPHSSFTYLPSGRSYGEADGMPGLTGDRRETKRHAADEWNVEQSYQRHLLQVGALDRFVGALVDRLKDVGIYDRSLVVLTADHGVSFRAGEHVRHATQTTFQDILAVPLFIKAPFQREGRIDDRPTELVDIVPSVAHLLETRLPWPVDGRSLFEEVSGQEGREGVTKVYRSHTPEPAAFTGLAQAMARAALRRDRLFGSGPWYPRLYARGPHGALVGRAVSEVPDAQASGIEVTVDRAARFSSVDPDSGLVPARVTGQVASPGSDPSSVALAVAVNGTIQAVTEPWKVPIGGREGLWSAMVPETAFRPGRNAVEVFTISEAGAEARLMRTRGSP